MTDIEELVERLNRRSPVYNDADEPTFLHNPDGPEAATALSAQQREIAELREASDPSIEGDPVCKIVSYDHAHMEAVELGYPSLTEAMEDIPRLKDALREARRWTEAAMNDRDTGLQPGNACFNAIQEIDAALNTPSQEGEKR